MNLPNSAKIDQAYTKLSSEEFAVMQKMNLAVSCERIGKLMRLTPEQISGMELYVNFVILGLYSEKDLREALTEENLSQLQLTEVLSQITDTIINPYLEEVAQLKAVDEDEKALEQADSGIEIIDEKIPEKTIPSDEVSSIATSDKTLLANDGVILEDDAPNTALSDQQPTENRDAILASLEHPQKSEGVALDKIVPKQEPTHATSIPIRTTPTFFETGPMGPSPVVVSPSPSTPVVVTEQTTLSPSYDKEGSTSTPPETLPIEPDEPTTPVINTIPITTTPTAPEKKRIENPGPIAINIPTPVIEKTVPVVTSVEPVPVVTTTTTTPVTQQAPLAQEAPVIPPAPQEPVFKDIPKVSIVDVGSLAPSKEPEGNPLEQPELLKAAQEHLRQLARERQKGFIAQKMTTTFSLPKTETVVGTTPKGQLDPYKETL